MSEYPGYSRNQPPKSIGDLSPDELKNTLFDPRLNDDEIIPDTADKLNIPMNEARELLGIAPSTEPVTDKEKYPYWTTEEYYERRIAMLKILSGIAMREGFDQASQYDQAIQDRYGKSLSIVQKGAQGRMDRGIHAFRELYGEKELNWSQQFDVQDIRDDANLMLSQMRREYSGPENKLKRQKERRRLTRKLKESHSSSEVA